MTHTCTVRTATGGCCGKPAVYTFTGSGGEVFSECADHYAGPVVPQGGWGSSVGPRVGDRVTVHRHGKTYDAVVTRVGKRGAVYARVTYGNGVTRTVRV